MSAIDDEPFGQVHRLFLQLLISKQILSETEAKDFMNQNSENSNFHGFLRSVNHELNTLGLQCKNVRDPIDGIQRLILVIYQVIYKGKLSIGRYRQDCHVILASRNHVFQGGFGDHHDRTKFLSFINNSFEHKQYHEACDDKTPGGRMYSSPYP